MPSSHATLITFPARGLVGKRYGSIARTCIASQAACREGQQCSLLQHAHRGPVGGALLALHHTALSEYRRCRLRYVPAMG